MTGIFCRILLHLKVLLEHGNRARFGVVDLAKFSSVAYWGNLLSWLVANRKWKSRRRCRVFFVEFLLHLEVLLELENMAWFGVDDLTKFSIVAYGEIG